MSSVQAKPKVNSHCSDMTKSAVCIQDMIYVSHEDVVASLTNSEKVVKQSIIFVT